MNLKNLDDSTTEWRGSKNNLRKANFGGGFIDEEVIVVEISVTLIWQPKWGTFCDLDTLGFMTVIYHCLKQFFFVRHIHIRCSCSPEGPTRFLASHLNTCRDGHNDHWNCWRCCRSRGYLNQQVDEWETVVWVLEDGGQRSGALALITAHPLTLMQRPQDAEVGAIYLFSSNLTFVQVIVFQSHQNRALPRLRLCFWSVRQSCRVFPQPQ